MSALVTDRRAPVPALGRFGAAFTTLSVLLAGPPSAQTLAEVRDPRALRAWPLPEHNDCRRGVALIAESAEAAEDPERLRLDHGRLFSGAERAKAPPYESAQGAPGTGSGLPMGALPEGALPAGALSEGTLPAELAPLLNRGLGADHIAVELAVAALLCTRAAQTAGESPGASGDRHALEAYLTEHLLAWAPRCLTRVANASGTYFYQGVAALGLGTLALAGATLLP